MSEELKIIENEDGTFSEYDDTFDITIHCQSEAEQNEVLAKLNADPHDWITETPEEEGRRTRPGTRARGREGRTCSRSRT